MATAAPATRDGSSTARPAVIAVARMFSASSSLARSIQASPLSTARSISRPSPPPRAAYSFASSIVLWASAGRPR